MHIYKIDNFFESIHTYYLYLSLVLSDTGDRTRAKTGLKHDAYMLTWTFLKIPKNPDLGHCIIMNGSPKTYIFIN